MHQTVIQTQRGTEATLEELLAGLWGQPLVADALVTRYGFGGLRLQRYMVAVQSLQRRVPCELLD